MVNADRQIIVIRIPQVLEYIFGQKTRVGEHQRRVVCANAFVDLRNRPCRRMAAPRYALLIGQQDFDLRLGPMFALHQFDFIHITPRCNPGCEGFGIGNGSRQCRALHIGRDGLQAGQ